MALPPRRPPSVGPDLVLSTEVATKATLVLTHVMTAVSVIPALSSRLGQRAGA
ncbi:MAG: DUF6069 family protein [Acidimicrobiales bacterium]